MPTAAERGREVRTRLLGAAAELIAERGWAAVSTRMLAERAGVAAGLVHYHFASLQALLTEAALGVLREAAGALAPLLDRAETPADAVALLMAALDDYTGTDPVSTVFAETYLAATRDPGLRDAVAGVVADFRDRLASWLRTRGVAAPRDTAAVLAAAVDGVLLHRALDPGMTAATVTPILDRILTGGTTWH